MRSFLSSIQPPNQEVDSEFTTDNLFATSSFSSFFPSLSFLIDCEPADDVITVDAVGVGDCDDVGNFLSINNLSFVSSSFPSKNIKTHSSHII